MAERHLKPEILVIGAGPGGSAAAWALAHSGHDVLLVDQAEFPRDKTCGDGLTPMAMASLHQMGVLAEVETAASARVEAARLVGPFSQTVTLPLALLETDYPYAIILPRYTLDDILRRHSVRAGAVFKGETRVEHIERDDDRVSRVHCSTRDGPLIIEPGQVVFAPGANMGMMAREGFIRQKKNVIRAARAYYTDVRIPDNRFDFYFDLKLMPGYGWIFPIGGGAANVGIGTMPVIWSSKRPTATLLKEFVAQRGEEGTMRASRLNGPIKGFPLRVDFPSHRIAGKNWVMVGEVTGLVNPVTGEGIDLALESALLAADLMHASLVKGKPNHIAYQRELWERFGPLYNGMRTLRNIVVTPFFTDYVLWLMTQHDFLQRITFKITQGLQPPQDIFLPLFILQFFTPISPRWAARTLRTFLSGQNSRRQAS